MGVNTTGTSGVATASGTGASPIITYEPAENFNGSDSFIVFVNDDGEGQTPITVQVNIAPQDDPPTISGSPGTSATQDIAYVGFTPTADDIDDAGAALSFSIQNKPSWAAFSTVTGALTGTPGASNVGGDFSNIIISVTSNSVTVGLAPFAITVSATAPVPAVWDTFKWDVDTWQELPVD